MSIVIRAIEQQDNPVMATLIREVFREFKIDMPGSVYTDPTTEHLYELFKTPGSRYWVAAEEGELLGGCGIYPTEGLPAKHAELVKFYLSAKSRGKGIGKQLMEESIGWAKQFGYGFLYLESFPELDKAVGMYKKAGFGHLKNPLGNSGHYACNIWMVKNL
ncbi:GNAT family N-acetyltransferase [soil metagenome]